MGVHQNLTTLFTVALWVTLCWLTVAIFNTWSPAVGGNLLSTGTAIICAVVFGTIAALTAGLVMTGEIPIHNTVAYEAVIFGSVIFLAGAFVGSLIAMPFAAVSWGWTVGATAVSVIVCVGLIWLFAGQDGSESPSHRHPVKLT